MSKNLKVCGARRDIKNVRISFFGSSTFLPLLLSPVVYILGRRDIGVNTVTWFSFGVLAISTGLLFIPALMLHGGQSAYVESYPWSQFGNFGLRLDGLSLPFALIIYILCTVLALYSKPYMIHKIMEDVHERFGAGSDGFSHGSSDHINDSHPSSTSTTNIEDSSSASQTKQHQLLIQTTTICKHSDGIVLCTLYDIFNGYAWYRPCN